MRTYILSLALTLLACSPPSQEPADTGSSQASAHLDVKRRTRLVSNTSMVIEPLGAIQVYDGTAWRTLANLTQTTINPAALSGGLANSTRYWVYARIVANTLTFTVTVDGPDAGLNYRSGDDSSMWVSTFITNASGNVIPQSQNELEFTYIGAYISTRILAAGTATTFTSVSYGALRPPNCSKVRLIASLVADGSLRSAILIQTTNGQILFDAGATAGYSMQLEAQDLGTIDYLVSNSAANLSLFLVGFTL